MYRLTTLFFLFLLISCETAEQDAVNKGQDCLDTATPQTALSCINSVSGYESKQAYEIRCSAYFLSEGMTASRIADALNAQKNTTTTAQGSSLLGMMSFFIFTDSAKANLTEGYCKKTGSAGFMLLGSMAKMATNFSKNSAASTVLNKVLAGDTPTQDDMIDALHNILANGNSTENQATFAVIGAATVEAYDDYCAGKNASANEEICNRFEVAVDGNTDDSKVVGQALLNELLNSSASIPL